MELTLEQSLLRESRGPLVEALGVHTSGKNVRCPFHSDHTPSATVRAVEGVWRFHCFTCEWDGDVFDVIAKQTGRPLADVLRQHRNDPEPEPKPIVYGTLDRATGIFANVEKVYKYTDPDSGEIDLAIVRYHVEGKKRFAQISPVADGWILKAPQGPLPLYNRTRVRESEEVIVVEGEKAVHALASVGLVATTAPGGAGKAHKADWSPLEGKKVYLWPDNDEPDEKTGIVKGVQHMKDVQQILEAKCDLFWIDPKSLDLPAKGDAYDFLKRNDGSKQDKKIAVQLVLEEAISLSPSRALEERLNLIMSGEWVNLEWPWRELTCEAQALLPDSVTALCGDPGAAKSFFMLQSFWQWHLEGKQVALFMLEDDKTYHQQRVLAQLEQNAHLTSTEWIANNPEKARESYQRQKDILDSFGRVVYDAPDQLISLPDLTDWFNDRCKEGAIVCGIDPVTAAQASDRPWIDDQKFIFDVKSIAKQYHSRLIYVIHPRVANGKAGPSLSRMAGGAAYARFSHSVLWLSRLESEQTQWVYSSDFGKRMVTFERMLKISKARNGAGAGMEIGFILSKDTLCFQECGSVTSENGVRTHA